jgi:hypothetical protein
MRWNDQGQSSNVEDRRGSSGGGGFGGGGPRLGLGGIVVVGILSLIFKRNLFGVLAHNSGGGSTGPAVALSPSAKAAEDKSASFVSFVLDDVQNTWSRDTSLGLPYPAAKLVLFTNRTTSGCGAASASTGPFYCPADRKVYIDLAFFHDLETRFKASGDFAQAYVIAHEVGHHLQNVLGTEQKLRRLQNANPNAANALSVAMELQADCYAGVWAHSANERKLLEMGDLEEGLGAASAVGDDRLQKAAGRGVNPESFTHGSAQQRSTWFRRGYDTGKIANCDTFAGVK